VHDKAQLTRKNPPSPMVAIRIDSEGFEPDEDKTRDRGRVMDRQAHKAGTEREREREIQ